MKLLVATNNEGKVREIREILTDSGNEIVGLCDLMVTSSVNETGTTFGENALIKARHYHSLTGLVTLADDSGLEVEELAGEPGVRSARYAGPEASDEMRINKLLGKLTGVPQNRRGARFVCAAGIVWGNGQRLFVSEVSGTILMQPRGSDGFGFDPVFLYPPLGKTFAELSRTEKSRISHRGKAFRRVEWWLEEGFVGSRGPC
jgi:XTP/dITP diphosphohydrolase